MALLGIEDATRITILGFIIIWAIIWREYKRDEFEASGDVIHL
jgi:hypothetical protein